MRDRQQRDRQRRIAAPDTLASNAEARSNVYAPRSIWTLGIIRDVGKWVAATPPLTGMVFQSGTGDVLRWQRMRYQRGQTPTFGEYETYGPSDVIGYPLEGKHGSDFTALKVVGAITSAAVPIRATWRGGFWIIETMGGAESVFPVNLTNPSGGDGSSIGPATWAYRVRDAITDATLLPAGTNVGASPHLWRRPPLGKMLVGTFGYAHRDRNGNVIVGWVNERPDQQACP